MFHFGPRTFTRAVLAGSLLSLTVAVVDTQAATQAASPAKPAPAQPAQAQPAQAQPAEPTPDSQLAAKIHKAIADDKALAGYAQTIKIIVSDGLVSLKGSARSEADKKALGAKADAIAGEKNVMNNLVIVGEASKTPTS
jgi:osmotically-inducible protein OsmY